ncbi:hypothetical protein V2J09_023189 [Rumex salicifolius]
MKSHWNLLVREMKLIFILIVVPVISAVGTADSQIAKPGCPTECGGVKIPFPFGTREGCFFNSLSQSDLYKINCDNSTGKPVPVLSRQTGLNENRSLLTVDFDDHTLRVSNQVAYACYQAGKLDNISRTYYSFDAAPFANSAKNKLVAVGCDTTARVGDNDRTQAYFTGCMTSCLTAGEVTDGTCSGIGCCEASIPAGIYMPYVNVDSFDNHRSVEKFNPCSFAFVSEPGGYNFSSAVLNYSGPEYPEIRVSALLDWAIFNRGNCSVEKESGNQSLCGSNSQCVDVFLVFPAYRCACLTGYSGNPYLSHGCQDIDECSDPSLNKCESTAKCVNTVGGYKCNTLPPVDPTATLNKQIIIGLSISLASILGLVFLAGLCKVLKRRNEIKVREQNFDRNGGLLLKQQLSAGEGQVDRTKIFTRSELEKATDNFNENRVLGRGGQGTVYKGMLEDGAIIAVKKSKKVDETQLSQFINEVVILSQINHRNVVQLFGCCLETEVPMLVYEYVPNGTLYQHIHNPSEDFHVGWKMRFQIAMECAGALAYLHSSSSSPVYHRDIKSSNILLDEKYKAKIADFGTSKTISIDQTHVTTCVQGTFGYLDPEFFQSSQFTEKSDVYSFGVVLLELLTSKKPVSPDTTKETRSLASEFLQLMEHEGELHHILDTRVLNDCPKEEIQAMANLVKRCLSLNGRQRPTMKEVAVTLEMIRSKHYQAAYSPIEGKEEELAWNDEMQMVVDGDFFSTSSTSACPEDCHSIDVQPLLFK